MLNNKNYKTKLKIARIKRKYSRNMRLIAALIALVVIILTTVIILRACNKKSREGFYATESDAHAVNESLSDTDSTDPVVLTPEQEHEKIVDEVINSYTNLGIVKVDGGYLNIRESEGSNSDIIGKLSNSGACEILDKTEGGWYHITSGDIDGYVHSDYVLSGDEAKQAARNEVRERAFVTTDKLYIRSEPSTEADVVTAAAKDERYEVIGEENGWIQIDSGYMKADYVEIKYALNEARKFDIHEMVLNMYDNIAVSEVDNYLNIREEPKEDGKIIGKMPSKAGGDIIETLDGWYKIKSGNVTGYVKSDYIATGLKAKDEAIQNATLMAVVNTDVLNARSEPKDSAAIWTQITNSERYPVIEQLDGWVKIELEEDDQVYVKTDYVDVRYALNEAIKFSPQEEAANASLSRRSQIVNYALQFLGNPYVWGGTSLTNGADCSGFTMGVMGHFGVGLDHYSGSQAKAGKSVSSSEMRPGDLVFYANSSGRINHVGIYIGNGQIVAAASKRSGIKISTWNYRNPVAIRNVLGD